MVQGRDTTGHQQQLLGRAKSTYLVSENYNIVKQFITKIVLIALLAHKLYRKHYSLANHSDKYAVKS